MRRFVILLALAMHVAFAFNVSVVADFPTFLGSDVNTSFNASSNQTAFDAFNSTLSLSYYSSGAGYNITAVNGVAPRGNDYWAFYVNGSLSMVGVSSYILQGNDTIELRYMPDSTGLYVNVSYENNSGIANVSIILCNFTDCRSNVSIGNTDSNGELNVSLHLASGRYTLKARHYVNFTVNATYDSNWNLISTVRVLDKQNMTKELMSWLLYNLNASSGKIGGFAAWNHPFGMMGMYDAGILANESIRYANNSCVLSNPGPGWSSGWGVDILTTSAYVLALEHVGFNVSHIQNSSGDTPIDYILSQQANNTGFGFFGSTDIDSTDWVVMALSMKNIQTNATQFIRNSQMPNGSTPYIVPGCSLCKPKPIEFTAESLLAFAMQNVNDSNSSRALSYILSVQRSNGCWSYDENQSSPDDPRVTAFAVMALRSYGYGNSSNVSKALICLKKLQMSDFGFNRNYQRENKSNAMDTALALMTLTNRHFDNRAPYFSFSLKHDDAYSHSVVIVPDAKLAYKCRYSNDNSTWSSWQSPTNVSWTLSPGTGEKRVYGECKDLAGNIARASASTTVLEKKRSGGSSYGGGGYTYIPPTLFKNKSKGNESVNKTENAAVNVSSLNASSENESYSTSNTTLNERTGEKATAGGQSPYSVYEGREGLSSKGRTAKDNTSKASKTREAENKPITAMATARIDFHVFELLLILISVVLVILLYLFFMKNRRGFY
ncbi:hypothetical protein DRN74_04130 [Candidatus Micrarchaeota archaeon]|nr:MAG: hypothetical protein DRN74_04130 [Candidatus Micrarchaeota archaeon]